MRTYQIVDGNLEVTETRPPRTVMFNAAKLNRRLNRLNAKIAELDNKITEMQSEKADAETLVAELAPFIGQI